MATSCYFDVDGGQDFNEPLDLEAYLQCAIPQFFAAVQIIIVAITIIFISFLIYKTVTNRENTKILEELPKQWIYTLLLAVVAVGAAGTIINIVLIWLGFNGFDYWLRFFNQLIGRL